MKKMIYVSIVAIFLLIVLESCENGLFNIDEIDVTIPDFNFPKTIVFEEKISSYNIFQGNLQDLIPSDSFQLLELSSVLFTDYAKKQRLIKLPFGQQIIKKENGSIDFPDGTILVKTFYYYNDERDITLGKRIIETRLLIKNAGLWNVGTYVWNATQTEAILALNGVNREVNWTTINGENRSTLYHVPTENECIACHQSNNSLLPLGITLRNLNRTVIRDNSGYNQLAYLQNIGVLNNFDISQIHQIVDYTNTNETLTNRARAYLDLNCSHCHHPNGWEESANEGLDFRYETTLGQTGILGETENIEEFISNGEMPFIGTTILDDDGINLIIDYLNTL